MCLYDLSGGLYVHGKVTPEAYEQCCIETSQHYNSYYYGWLNHTDNYLWCYHIDIAIYR